MILLALDRSLGSRAEGLQRFGMCSLGSAISASLGCSLECARQNTWKMDFFTLLARSKLLRQNNNIHESPPRPFGLCRLACQTAGTGAVWNVQSRNPLSISAFENHLSSFEFPIFDRHPKVRAPFNNFANGKSGKRKFSSALFRF